MKFKLNLLKDNNFFFRYLPLLLSFLTLSGYFFQIKYFPIVNAESFITICLFTSFVLFLIIFFLCVPLFISSSIQNTLIKNQDTCSLLFSSKFHTLFFKIINKERKKRRESFIIEKLSVRLFLYHLLFCTWLIITSYSLILSIIASILIYFFLLFFGLSGPISFKRVTYINSKPVLTLVIMIAFIASNLCLFTTTKALQLLSENKSYIQIISIYLPLLMYSIITLIPNQKIKIKEFWAPIVLFTIIFTLLLRDGSFFKVPKLIIKYFHIGAMEKVTLSTDKKGCELFKMKGYTVECKKDNSVFLLTNIDVLWRAGELFLQFKDRNGVLHHVITTSHMRIYDIDSAN